MASSSISDVGVSVHPVVPPTPGNDRLQSGDHMDRATFHSRYLSMPPDFRAELVEGVVFVSSPTSPHHGHPHSLVSGALVFYEASTPGARAYENTTVYPNANSEVQPDSMLIVLPELGGKLRWENGYFAGGPEFVGEIAYSSEAYDLHSKLRIYEQAGVLEYFVLLLKERQAVFFRRRDDRFESCISEQGVFRSHAFPGLWLDEAAMLTENTAGMFATLQRGLATPEHAEFVKRLESARPRS